MHFLRALWPGWRAGRSKRSQWSLQNAYAGVPRPRQALWAQGPPPVDPGCSRRGTQGTHSSCPQDLHGPARAFPGQWPLQPHLIQVNLALRILEIHVQVECRNPVLGDPYVSQVGHRVEVLGKTNRQESSELQRLGPQSPVTPGKHAFPFLQAEPVKKKRLQADISDREGERERTWVSEASENTGRFHPT